MEIELATSSDVSEICRLVQLLSPGSPHDYRDAIKKFNSSILPSPDYFLWVVKEDGKIIGTGMMHLQHKLSYRCGTAAHLEDVVVDLDQRGKGVGRLIVDTAIQEAKKHNCYKLMLTCFEKTIPYYESFGFEKHDIGMRLNLKELYESS